MDTKTRRTIGRLMKKIKGHLKKGISRRFARMQVPCKLSLSGQPKFVSFLRKELIKMKEI